MTTEANSSTSGQELATLAGDAAKALAVAKVESPELVEEFKEFFAAYEAAEPHIAKAAESKGLNFAEDERACAASSAMIASGKKLAATLSRVASEVKGIEAQ